MPNKPPPRPPNGGKWPGTGRAKGTPNKISVEVRELVGQLVNDAVYQFKLRQDFRARKVHPTIEALIWTYHLGKPRQDITLNATIDVNARLEEERRIFASLDLPDLERLAGKSQALIEEATALVAARSAVEEPQHLVCEVKPDETPSESLDKSYGSDNFGYVNDSAEVPEAGEGEQ
jgi:hypothetical protein